MGGGGELRDSRGIGNKAPRQGSIIPLSEIATIKDAYLEPEDYARLNLDQNVSVYVKKASLANTIKVVDELIRVVDGFTEERGGDIRTVVIADKAKLIKRAIGDVRDSLFIGVLFVSLIIYLALRQMVLSLIVFVTIPISVISTFFFMAQMGLSINVMTLSGLALSIGILVDSAVVVIENAVKKREEGLPHQEAVVQGAEEMWIPLVASLLTSLCVFLPIIFIDEQIRLMYQGFTFTVCFALTMSLVVAVMLVPMMLSKSRFYEGGGSSGTTQEKGNSFFEKLKNRYGIWLQTSFRLRYPFLAIVFLTFAFSLWRLAVRHIDLPTQLDENEFEIIVFPLAGAKLDANDEVARRIERLLHEFKEVKLISTMVQKHDLRIFVQLEPRQKRKRSKEMIMEEIREKGNKVIKEVHDQYSLIVDEGAASEESKKLVINIFGLETDKLEELAREVAQKINSVQGLSNLVMTDLRKRPEYSIVVDKGRAAFYGLTVRNIADSIHALVRGMRPTKFHELEKGLEIETITRLQPVYRQKIEDLEDLYLVSPLDGTKVKAKQIAGFYPSRGPQSIDRKNKYRYVFVKGDTSKPLETVAESVKGELKGVEFPRDYFWRFGGQYEDLMKGKSKLAVCVALSIALIYMVLACLYQSYSEPLMIMISIPLAAVGVWAALAFTRKPLSEQVFIGMFILVGYTVNGAIILIDRINCLRKQGGAQLDYLIQAGKDRLRPILVTTGSTVIGFIPMALSKSESSELWSPLAITMIGGIISSTVLTLFVIPLVYLLFDDIKKSRKIIAGRRVVR